MSRQLSELQTVLTQLAAEHRNLLSLMEAQHVAMTKFDTKLMAELVTKQEASRLQINAMDTRRRALNRQIATQAKLSPEPSLRKLAETFPQYALAFLNLRDELRDVMQQISRRSYMSTKLSGAVLGHLNVAMRMLASAVERAGVYTKRGVPQLGSRIGSMEAVG